MKTLMRKALCLLLCLTMGSTALPVAAGAEGVTTEPVSSETQENTENAEEILFTAPGYAGENVVNVNGGPENV